MSHFAMIGPSAAWATGLSSQDGWFLRAVHWDGVVIFWHDELAADDDAGDAVQCAELCVPGFLGLY